MSRTWESNGIRGWAPTPGVLGEYRGTAIVLGGGRCVWDDYDQVRAMPHEVVAVNDIGAVLHRPITHFVTLHPEYLPYWKFYRARHGYQQEGSYCVHSHRAAPHVQYPWKLDGGYSTGGLFASYVALALGYERVILCGCPATRTGHFFDPPWADSPDFEDRAQTIEWEWAVPKFRGRVFSMSGRTRDWLGVPDEALAA